MWYFAYGSNMEAGTFRGRRNIEPLRALPARAPGWRLVLDKPTLLAVGEAVANIVRDPGAEVLGVLYEVTADDLAHIELTEGVRIGVYQRVDVPVVSLTVPPLEVMAASLSSPRRDASRRPSQRYMACVIRGAEEHGLPAAWIEYLRSVPVCPESAESASLRALLDAALQVAHVERKNRR
jgi:hypothetical protein